MFNWTARGKLGTCLKTSRRLMGGIELWEVEPSIGPQKDSPLSFQSDYHMSVSLEDREMRQTQHLPWR